MMHLRWHAAVSALGRYLSAYRWGGAALISLFLSVISGIVVALQYNPVEPYYSTSAIELIVPYGAFWRALHYYSSQAFFLLLLAHAAIEIWRNEYNLKQGAWIRLCLSVPCALLLLFTGYVLRGDATGEAAGAIAEHIAKAIPLIGDGLNDVLFDLNDSGVRKVYAQHVIGLMVLGGVAAWPHLRRYTAQWRNHPILTVATILLSGLIAAPIEPSHFGITFIAGPWFFLGLQELLRFWPPFVAGVAAPMIPMVLLLWLPRSGRARMYCLLAIGLWLVLYGILTMLCLQRI